MNSGWTKNNKSQLTAILNELNAQGVDIDALTANLALANLDLDSILALIGNKNDFIGIPYQMNINSLFAYLVTGYYHVHGEAFVYPKYVNPILLTANAASWNTTGLITEIIPANTLTKAFDLHWISISDISETCYGVLDLYAGGAGAETLITSVEFFRNSNFVHEGNKPLQIPQQSANTRISAKISTSTTNATTVRAKLYGHYYG